jgi:hypothetical protein
MNQSAPSLLKLQLCRFIWEADLPGARVHDSDDGLQNFDDGLQNAGMGLDDVIKDLSLRFKKAKSPLQSEE